MEFKELGKSGVKIPVLGLGTWGMGGFSSSSGAQDAESVEALRLGLSLGIRFIDTAEMYGHGHSEEVVARVVQDERENVFIATKVSGEHLSHDGVLKACESSLRRLQTSYIDLYQVHWPNPRIPISETMKAMERLVGEGKVRYIGVSNFSVHQTQEAQTVLSRARLESNQVEYSLLDRSIEEELLPYCEKERITVIAYSPVGRGEIPRGARGDRWRVLDQIASKLGKTKTQIALNWLIIKNPVVAIPKASSLQHVTENAGAVGWRVNPDDELALSQAFK
jgi:aryl-alcohol dehydrogenase-like predicted oxidoreductase